MKIKSKTKKIIVLSVMVALLIATGVLNFVLNDKLNSTSQISGNGNTDDVTQTFLRRQEATEMPLANQSFCISTQL
ncbi:MAG: hypothetical protein L6V83_01300 [Christensenella sp.]|nr:MAG: hypothetical protein L6V83_01300 [Christensenella sp.]